MFVVFEGIDGSGKTTVSGRVAKALRRRGVAVEHFREGGEFASSLVNRLREFGKDPRNLALEPLPELLFYLAREAQLADELVRPALARGGLVFADRYLDSFGNLAANGRRLDPARVRPIVEAVAGGLWPDLVILLDIDPHLARARRQVSKIARQGDGPGGGGSRKGLGGIGLLHRLRDGYLEMAAARPNWLVLDNCAADLDALVEAATEAVAALWAGAGPTAALAVGRDRLAAATRRSIDPPPGALAAAPAAFYRMIAARAEREPAVAAYLVSGVSDGEAYDWLDRLAEPAPEVVASGLGGDGHERAWQLRQRLAERAPHQVARSLDGLAVEGPRAETMRLGLAPRVPRAVLGTLGGNDSEAAWLLREQLIGHASEVVASLKRLASERAWRLRDRYLADHGGEPALANPLVAAPLLASVRGLGDERAWHLRRLTAEVAPAEVIISLAGVEGEEAWTWRERHAGRAGKLVFRTIDGDASERAFRLRERYADTVKEALDSISGLDGDAAWALRDRLADRWPSTVVKSLGPLGLGARGRALAERLLIAHPDNPSLLKHAASLALSWLAPPVP